MYVRILSENSTEQNLKGLGNFDVATVQPSPIDSSMLEGVSNEEEYEDDFGFDDR